MFKLSIEQAKDQKAGSFLGRLHMAYLAWAKEDRNRPQPELSLTTTQYGALAQYQEMHNDWRKAVRAPGAYYEPHLGSSGDEDAHARWANQAKEKYTLTREAIQEAQNFDRANNLWAALDLCVLQELELPHMMGSLRTLANALARHYAKAPKRKELRYIHSFAEESL